MELSDQVISLEYAKRLQELGAKQDSLFYYQDMMFQFAIITNISKEDKKALDALSKEFPHCKRYSALTVSELLDLLPPYIDTNENHPFNGFDLRIVKKTAKNIKYIVNYFCDSFTAEHPWIDRKLIQPSPYDNKLADALAKMLIYLIENNLIKVKE